MMEDSQNLPEVSVVMPVKNSELTLAETIDSIIQQTCSNFEFIIVDDNSNDKTPEILEQYAQKDARIRIFKSIGKGICDAVNQGLDVARAPLIARMDADDIAHPERFELQINAFKANKKLVLVGSNYFSFKGSLEDKIPCHVPESNEELQKSIRVFPTFGHPTIMAKAEAIRRVGAFRRAFEGAEDHDLYLRLSRVGEIQSLPDFLLLYRIHSRQVMQTKRARGMRASVAALYCDMCVGEGMMDPGNGNQTCDTLALDFLKYLAASSRPLSRKQVTICVRAIEGLSDLPSCLKEVVALRKTILFNLMVSTRPHLAIKFFRETRGLLR